MPRPPPQTPPIVRYRGVWAGVGTAPPNRTRPHLEVYLGFRVGDSCIPQLRGDEGETTWLPRPNLINHRMPPVQVIVVGVGMEKEGTGYRRRLA